MEGGRGYQPLIDVLAQHGALELDDGSWVMPVAFWVGDRFTGRNHPVRVDFPLEGFDGSALEAYRIDEFQLPPADIEYLADRMPSP